MSGRNGSPQSPSVVSRSQIISWIVWAFSRTHYANAFLAFFCRQFFPNSYESLLSMASIYYFWTLLFVRSQSPASSSFVARDENQFHSLGSENSNRTRRLDIGAGAPLPHKIF